MEKKTKKKIAIAAVIAAAVVGFFAFGNKANSRVLSAADKLVRDANTPGTPLHETFASYMRESGRTDLANIIAYHLNTAIPGAYINLYLRKPSYAENEVVSLVW